MEKYLKIYKSSSEYDESENKGTFNHLINEAEVKSTILPYNEIRYEASSIIKPFRVNYSEVYGRNGQPLGLIEHTFENGVGHIIFDGDIVSIGEQLFVAANMTKLYFPNTLEVVGESGLTYCTAREIVFGDGLSSIGKYGLGECRNLTSVKLSKNLQTIGDSAFYECNHLETIDIPKSVTSIGGYAFYGCSGLTTVVFEEGSNLTYIDGYCFANCRNLESIVIPNSVERVEAQTFAECKSLSSVTLSNNLKVISYYAFSNCPLTSITIPSTIVEVYEGSLTSNSLQEINIEATTPPDLPGPGRSFPDNGCPIYVPCESVDIYKVDDPDSEWYYYSGRITCHQ